VPYAQVVTSTTHKSLRGPRGAFIMSTEAQRRNVDRAVFPYAQGGPLMHAIAAKAVCFGEALRPEFKEYGQAIVSNAKTLASTLEESGLRIVSGGTDNHLMLVDLRALEITGAEAEECLGRAGITVNKNAIPNDPQPPRVTSGLRLGTPSITSRGFRDAESRQVGELIVRALNHRGDETVESEVREAVLALTSRFPVPGLDF
jgi:glycine hydroxymethyltransferase